MCVISERPLRECIDPEASALLRKLSTRLDAQKRAGDPAQELFALLKIPDECKPRMGGGSPRVAAQKDANQWP